MRQRRIRRRQGRQVLRAAIWICSGLAMAQAPMCTDEQIQEQLERGLTTVFNLAAYDVLNLGALP